MLLHQILQWHHLLSLVLPPDDELERTAIQIEVVNPTDGSVWVAEAPYYVYDKTSQLVTHPDIQPGWWADLYVAPSQYLPAPQAAPGLVQLEAGQAREVLGYKLTFQQFDIPNREAMMRGEAPAEVFAVVDVVAPDGTTTTVRPVYRVGPDGAMVGEPIEIPGGATLAMQGLDPASRAVQLQFGGIDLSQVDPNDLKARVFVEISVEPGIRLVWAGIIIGLFGGLLAWAVSISPASTASSTRIWTRFSETLKNPSDVAKTRISSPSRILTSPTSAVEIRGAWSTITPMSPSAMRATTRLASPSYAILSGVMIRQKSTRPPC